MHSKSFVDMIARCIISSSWAHPHLHISRLHPSHIQSHGARLFTDLYSHKNRGASHIQSSFFIVTVSVIHGILNGCDKSYLNFHEAEAIQSKY